MSGVVRILLPTDASPSALRAVEHVIDLAAQGLAVEVHLLNVQIPVRGSSAALIDQAELDDYHRAEGMKVLERSGLRLEQAGLVVHRHVGVGDPGETILAFSRQLGCAQIVMGTRGMGGVIGMIMGSVANHVVSESDLPVTLLREVGENPA